MPDMRNAQAGARCHEVDVLTPATTRDTLEPPGHAASTDVRPGLRKGGVAVNALGWSSALSVLYSGGDDNTVRAWYDYKQLEEADPGGEGEARAEVKVRAHMAMRRHARERACG